MSHDLPASIKVDKNSQGNFVLLANCTIEKDTKLEILNGNIICGNSNYNNNNNLLLFEIFDNNSGNNCEHSTRNWFEMDTYPKWLELLSFYNNNQNIHGSSLNNIDFNLRAYLTNNQVKFA
jgi:hypothetical protein